MARAIALCPDRLASSLDDPEDRHAYLTNIEANARTLALAEKTLAPE